MTKTPVTVLTGFLGAGKTTLLSKLLARPELARAAVLINEFGEVAIDHHLIREVKGDTIILGSGCICCSVHGDLIRVLTELYGKAARGEIPPYDRVLIETTGISDPTSVVASVLQHPLLSRLFEPAAIVTAVDGVLGAATLKKHREAVKQVALADRIIITKSDVASPEALASLEEELAAITPLATIVRSAFGDVDPEIMLARGRDEAPQVMFSSSAHSDVKTFVVTFDKAVRPGPLAMWLSLMTQMHGEQLLRVKGLVAIEGEDVPMAIHCVQHLAYPPSPLAAWPDESRTSRLVFITRGLTDSVNRSLRDSLLDTLGVLPP